MNNYRSNNRKHRFKSNNDRNFRKRPINPHKNQNEFNSNIDFRHRNPGRNNQNAAKLIDKYNNLAREALSGGDKILSENYFQHADHFTRVLNEQETIKKAKFSSSLDGKNGNMNIEKKEVQTATDKDNEKSDKPQSEVS